MSWIHLYDEDELDLKTARRQLQKHGIADPVTPVDSHVNRIDLFETIASSREALVALIDLQSDERTDNSYSGYRVIETIRRHPLLAARCRPLAYTVHAREDVIELARKHGALALISKHDLDVPIDEVARVNLLGYLEEQRLLVPSPFGERAAPEGKLPVFPDSARARERFALQDRQLQSALRSVCSGTPRIATRPYFWQTVRSLAEGIDLTSTAHWIQADFDVPARTVENDLDDLRRLLEPRYLGHGPAWVEFARDLLMAAPQRRRAPSDTDMVRCLQRLSEVEPLLQDAEIRKASYLDEAALRAIDRVVLAANGGRPGLGHVGDWVHTDHLLARLAAVEPDENARKALQVDFVRGVSNMYDTYMAQTSRV
ncbi:MAG TPA: hypothetical protein VFV03_00185 [Solirubrobacteraceae bacterium]|nr:hypothetical protein [Solirubrobacteraceae bacterium]